MEDAFALVGIVIGIILIIAQFQLFAIANETRKIRELFEFVAMRQGMVRDPKELRVEVKPSRVETIAVRIFAIVLGVALIGMIIAAIVR